MVQTYTIEVNADRQLEVQGGQSLLSALKGRGIYLPSACGGRGICGMCTVRVLDDLGPLNDHEQRRLKETDLQAGKRLACQVSVDRDLRIEVPDEMLVVHDYRGRVEQVDNLTHDIKLVRISLIEPATITFTPGQYVQLQAPAGSGCEQVSRAYSLAGPPEQADVVDLIIRLVPGGICTTWVFEHLSAGDLVEFYGPMGEFRLSRTNREMIWVGGGSGMAPFWSMVRHMINAGIERPTRYFFGAVRQKDLFLVDELESIAAENEWFEFIPALSGPDGGTWNGQVGLVSDVMDRMIDRAPDAEAYLCGAPGMIDAASEVLKEKGVNPRRIFYDRFA